MYSNRIIFKTSLEDEVYDIKVSDGLSDILSKNDLEEIKEKYISSYFENDEWDNGVKNGYNAIYEKIVKAKELDIDYTKPIDPNNEDNVNSKILTIIISLVIIVVTIICIVIEYTRKNKKENKVNKYKKSKSKK